MEENRTRTRIFVILICAVLGVLTLRLGKIQILDTSTYTGESRNNAIRERRILPARGSFYDRNGVLMVDNELAYTVLVTPRYFDEANISFLATLLNLPDSLVANRYQEARNWNSFRPSWIERGVSFDVLSRVMENHHLLPGVSYEVDQKRLYMTSARAAHALGFVRQISRSDLETRRAEGYRPGDLIGQTGLERNYERRIRGSLGSEFNLVNSRGQVIESYLNEAEDIAPISGFNLELTLDSEVQALAESLFVNKRGAVVALEPSTGEIITFLSAPDYDLETFTRAVSPEAWRFLRESEEKPLFNRASMSMLPPGSTFKPFIALLALESGVITPSSTVTCPGYHPIGRGRIFKCMHVHGTIAVQQAIRESCNTFFFEMMRRIDVNTFSRFANRFGFGERSEVDIGEQDAGLIPDSAYFNRVNPGGWTVGTPMNLGIGQGDMGVTPLQLARYIAALGNGGVLPTPHLLRRAYHPDTGEIVYPDIPEPVKLDLNPRFMEIVRNALREVVEETSPWLQIPNVSSAGKTGTAQNSRGDDDAVYVLFAPFDNPRIAIAVMVENAGFGSMSAGPIASFLAEKYLTGTISPTRNWLFQQVLDTASGPLPSGDETSTRDASP
ncbi:MAG: penicillin-binding protein 2 [Bacteroidetes bacterium]|nr:penicillin-binding protein 2 [Bacteroidota bacterium]